MGRAVRILQVFSAHVLDVLVQQACARGSRFFDGRRDGAGFSFVRAGAEKTAALVMAFNAAHHAFV